MKYRFPIFTAILLTAGWAVWPRLSSDPRLQPLLAMMRGKISSAVAEEKEPESPRGDEVTPKRLEPVVDDPNAPNGNGMILDAAQNLFRLPSLEARLHQGIEMFGHQVDAQGIYLQQGAGDIKLLHLYLRMNAAEHITVVQQVCDGRFLWSWRDSPFEKRRTRIDLKEVRRAFDAHPDVVNKRQSISQLWMELGGLPKLLQGLHQYYEFAVPRAEVINQSPGADTKGERGKDGNSAPVWVVTGRLKKEVLATFLPQQREAILNGQPANLAALPPQWPDRVAVWLGRDDALPLFPYRIEFQRTRPGATGANNDSSSEATTMLWLQLSDVAVGTQIDPQKFRYPAGTRDVPDDDTQRFLQSLGIQ